MTSMLKFLMGQRNAEPSAKGMQLWSHHHRVWLSRHLCKPGITLPVLLGMLIKV